MDINVLVPIAQGSEEIEAVVVIDLLRRAGINVKVAGENQIVTCSRGIKILPDVLFNDMTEDDVFDAIVLPGGSQGTQNLIKNEQITAILKSHKQKGKLLAAICAAPTILSEQKLIDKDALITSHPSVKNQLDDFLYSEEKVVSSKNLITGRGAGTAIEFALEIISTLVDRQAAEKIAAQIVY